MNKKKEIEKLIKRHQNLLKFNEFILKRNEECTNNFDPRCMNEIDESDYIAIVHDLNKEKIAVEILTKEVLPLFEYNQ